MENRFGRVVAAAVTAVVVGFLMGCTAPWAEKDRATGFPSRGISGISAAIPGGSVCDLDELWESDTGGKIKLADLRGRVRVISMFYSTCQGPCRATLHDLQMLETVLTPATRARVGFVLATLDPGQDTIDALRAYRRAEGLSPARWTLLRGDRTGTRRLARLLGISSGRDASNRFVHSSELVVLDESGRLLYRHDGLHANLDDVAREIESAAVHAPKASATPDPVVRHQSG